MKQKKLIALLNELEQPFNYLAWKLGLNSESKKDTLQELRMIVIKDYKKNKTKGVGWWFLRAKWHLLNRLTKHMRDPLDNAISIESFFDSEE